MSQEIAGLDNNIEIRLIYLDTKEEVHFKSIAAAARKVKKPAKTIRLGLNPVNRQKFNIDGRIAVFRIKN